MIFLIAIAAGSAIFLIALYIALGSSDRSDVRKSLNLIETYQVSRREQELLQPLQARVVTPAVSGLTKLAIRVTPVGYAKKAKEKWILAGSPPNLTPDRMMVLKGIGLLSGAIWFVLIVLVLQMRSLIGIGLWAFLWAGAFWFADLRLNRAVEERANRIRRDLPDLLDLLVISVEAGLGFEQALERTATVVPGPLSDEFKRVIQEIRIGASRSQALRAMEERTDVPELRSFILAILQADQFGVSISRILRSQAEDARLRRRQRVQELAQKAPVKMLFPLVFCIFPSAFVVLLGPAVINITRALS